MAKKNGLERWLSTNAVSLVIAVALLAIVYGLYTGKISLSVTNIFGGSGGTPWYSITNITSTNQYYLYTATLSIDKNSCCINDYVGGTISTNIPNGRCSFWTNFNNAGWQFDENVNLDANGQYTEVRQVVIGPGQLVMWAICADAQGNAKLSNQLTLVINNCSTGNGGNNNPNGGGGIACNAVWNPTEATCEAANCPTGQTCTYIAATTTHDAYCGCKSNAPSGGCEDYCVSNGYVWGLPGYTSETQCHSDAMTNCYGSVSTWWANHETNDCCCYTCGR